MVQDINSFICGQWIPDETFPRYSLDQVEHMMSLNRSDGNSLSNSHTSANMASKANDKKKKRVGTKKPTSRENSAKTDEEATSIKSLTKTRNNKSLQTTSGKLPKNQKSKTKEAVTKKDKFPKAKTREVIPKTKKNKSSRTQNKKLPEIINKEAATKQRKSPKSKKRKASKDTDSFEPIPKRTADENKNPLEEFTEETLSEPSSKKLNTKSLKYMKQRSAALRQMVKETQVEEDYYKDKKTQPNLSLLFSNSAYSDDSLTIKTPKTTSKAPSCITPRTRLLGEWGDQIENKLNEQKPDTPSVRNENEALNVLHNCLNKAPRQKKPELSTPKRKIISRKRSSRLLKLPSLEETNTMDQSAEDYFET